MYFCKLDLTEEFGTSLYVYMQIFVDMIYDMMIHVFVISDIDIVIRVYLYANHSFRCI